MQHNPYTAPQTNSNEVCDAPRRPASVKLAAAFIVCSFLAGHSKFFFIATPTSGIDTGVAFALIFCISALLIAAVLSPLSWARWVVAVLLAGNVALFPFAIERASLSALRFILVLQAIFQLAALVLMLLSSSSKWYGPRSPAIGPLPVESLSTRPATVAIAAWLFGINYASGLFHAIANTGFPKAPPLSVGLVFGLVVSSATLLAICSRRNWGRWLALILMALNIFVIPDLISRNTGVLQVLYATQGVLQLACVVLLLMPASSRWYRPSNSVKSASLSDAA